LTFIFAVLNICLGFALAIYLGYGRSAVLEVPAPSGIDSNIEPKPAAPLEPPAVNSNVPAPDAIKPETTEKPIHANSNESLNPLLNWNFDDQHVEKSILRLNVAIAKSNLKMNEVDTNLRMSLGHSNEELIESCLYTLQDDCSAYLSEQQEATEKVLKRSKEFGNMEALCSEIEMTNLKLAAQVETTLSNLHYMDFKTDLEAANRRLIEEIKNLSMLRNRLRDDNELAFLKVARSENRLDKIEEPLRLDPITEILNRLGLEATLVEWWRQNVTKTHQTTAVLLDIDKFSLVNEQFGLVAGDRILRQFGELVRNIAGPDGLAGRYAGQKFLAMVLDATPEDVKQKVDLLRQSLEKTVFLYNDQPIRITAGGAIIEVVSYHSYLLLFEKLEEILQEAKNTGPNRLLYFSGRAVEPVEFPGADVQETEVVI
jgi:diguanylate cyclase